MVRQPHHFLNSIEFKRDGFDSCVMGKTINGKQLTLVLHVDDILILSKRDTNWLAKQLQDRYTEVSFIDDTDLSYRSMSVRLEAGKTTLSVRSYVKNTRGYLIHGGSITCY